MRKQYIEVPLPMSCSFLDSLWTNLKGSLLSPLYLLIAKIKGAPGTGFHLKCIAVGICLLITRRVSVKTCCRLIFYPMDSTRYFEFHEIWQRMKGQTFSNYLDVSSPRLIPMFLLKAVPGAKAELINPDLNDLQETEKMAKAFKLKSRCNFNNDFLDNSNYNPASFDLITCISVLEHIPQDKEILEILWSLLRPGGKIILTFPCMAQPLEQYISYNQYGILEPEDNGYTFWQRYYDSERIQSNIFNIVGMPSYVAIYGEKKCGFFFRNACMKRLLGALYPFWREPYMMSIEYKYFSATDELPGEGVAMLEFTKPGEYK